MRQERRRWRRALLVVALVVTVLTPALALGETPESALGLRAVLREVGAVALRLWIPALWIALVVLAMATWFYGWVPLGPRRCPRQRGLTQVPRPADSDVDDACD